MTGVEHENNFLVLSGHLLMRTCAHMHECMHVHAYVVVKGNGVVTGNPISRPFSYLIICTLSSICYQ